MTLDEINWWDIEKKIEDMSNEEFGKWFREKFERQNAYIYIVPQEWHVPLMLILAEKNGFIPRVYKGYKSSLLRLEAQQVDKIIKELENADIEMEGQYWSDEKTDEITMDKGEVINQ